VRLTEAVRLPQQTAAPSGMLSSRAAFLMGMATPAQGVVPRKRISSGAGGSRDRAGCSGR